MIEMYWSTLSLWNYSFGGWIQLKIREEAISCFWGLQLELNRLTSFFFVPHSLEPLLRETADVAPRGYFFNSCCELCDLNFVSCARNPCFSMPYFIKTWFWMTFVMFLTMDWCQKCKLCAISCDLRFVLEMTIQCNPAQPERVLCCALTIVNIFLCISLSTRDWMSAGVLF